MASALGLLQCLGQLVRTGGGLAAAADALHPLDGLLHRHPLQQHGDALKVAAAPAHYLDGLDEAVLHLDGEGPGADPPGCVLNGHIETAPYGQKMGPADRLSTIIPGVEKKDKGRLPYLI